MRKKTIYLSAATLVLFIICIEYFANKPAVSVSNNVQIQASKDITSKGKEENKKTTVNKPFLIDSKILNSISYSVLLNSKKVTDYSGNNLFPSEYTDIEGILTFRGNNLRTSPSYGVSSISEKKLSTKWSFTTSSSSWGGGAGWTGQPAIIKWPTYTKELMNIKDKFKQQENFTEVISSSLDGNVYFLDLETGEKTRDPIRVGNPIKGSVSIDPRGIPLLYVGEGIPEKGPIGYDVFSLIDGSKLSFINGMDTDALRGWGAFDSSALINKQTDTLIEAGENGLLYIVKLNTKFDIENKSISIAPETTKYRYQISGHEYQGIENSTAIYKNLLYFADNGGSIQCIDLLTLKPVWTFNGKDDTDASLVVDVEDNIPYIYSGNEIDKQGYKGYSYLKKINGLTGEAVWEKTYECMSVIGNDPVNGGMLATPVVGKQDTKDIIIFGLARYKNMNSGLILALDKKTGAEIWRKELPNYMWSSPVDFYDKNGKTYIIQCDSIGNMYLLDGKTGSELNKINLGSNIEATPSIFNDTIVVATRGGKFYGISIK
ncbi:PQQ-binding-like beta-propeller repeat protein [Clostridium sp. A1-XYC3]|uniref:PQQ-binding-like beta-propeller repeat protein n=1 Tax=Clostridium tanneri TaxID=3037988 RepID=A0ABU4JY63_9CLOT|nr:PQQ-binding-like beta-propeller repeat protein [Clostridium sp. A1-XYC3]MDW8802851.1 PQQ-binding-like beta-propeller repeat protein [Clostridium sp. A1-XYC3]